MPMASLNNARRGYATGGSIDINVTPTGSVGAPNFIGANSSVPAPAASSFTARPPVAPTAQPAFSPQPYSNAIANVPVGGTSGAPTSPAIAPIGANGIPGGMPPGPVTVPTQALGLKRGGVPHMAQGGQPTPTAWFGRQEARQAFHPPGLVKGMAGGRTDVHPISVPSGSYIMPADVVSGLAEGNTMAGSGVIDRMMNSGPFGMKLSKRGGGGGPPKAPHVSAPPMAHARGGKAETHGEEVPIIVAGGEHIIYPQTILQKFGNLKRGHEVLDKFVTTIRKQTIDEMKKLKGPKK